MIFPVPSRCFPFKESNLSIMGMRSYSVPARHLDLRKAITVQ